MEIDLHGYHPSTLNKTGLISEVVRQAWEMGEKNLVMIHGHSLWRGTRRPFANTNTGWLGLTVRCILRNSQELRQWMYARIDVSHEGSTRIRLRTNPNPTRTALNYEVLPELDFRN